MTIKAVDMQVLLPRVSEVSRVQTIQQQENNLRQTEIASQMAQQQVKNESSVSKTPRSEAAYVKERAEKEKSQENQQENEGNMKEKENKNNQAKNDTGKKTGSPGGKIDIIA